MTDEEITAFLNTFPMFKRGDRWGGALEFFNTERPNSGALYITTRSDHPKKVRMVLTPRREWFVDCETKEHDNLFESFEAAANYALVNGLLV